MRALALGLASAVAYGVWAWADEKAVRLAGPLPTYLCLCLGYLALNPLEAGLAWGALPRGFQCPSGAALAWVALTAVAGSAGSLLFLYSLQAGSTRTAVPLSALYPLVAVGLSALSSGEHVGWRGWVACFLAVVVVALLA